MARAKLSSLPEWQRWREDILASLSVADESQALRNLGALRQQLEGDEQIASSLYRAMLTAHMGGQLFVREIEVPESVALSRRVSLDDTRRSPFFRQTFAEALRAFLSRQIVTPEQWGELSDAMRLRAFTATRLASQQLVERAQRLLTEALANGSTLRQFTAGMRSGEVALGIEPATPWYLETVFRTNTQVAYGQGRLEQLDNPVVLNARPYVQYRTAGDTRVRQAHRMLNGVTFDRSRDPGWRRYAPPLGYNCRCSLVTVREPGTITASTDLQVGPDPGWVGPGMG